MTSTALLVGGSSEIGIAVLKKLLGPPPRDVVLAGRPSGQLWQNAEELRDLGYHVTSAQYDATLHAGEIEGLLAHLSAHHPVGLAVIAVGSMSAASFEDGLVVNGLAVALLVHALVQRLTDGQLVLLSSALRRRTGPHPRHTRGGDAAGRHPGGHGARHPRRHGQLRHRASAWRWLDQQQAPARIDDLPGGSLPG
ncbi:MULTISPECIES: SDR family oxidoreductase [Kribbella]|uniref:SDR family oxidoreductase n=1 Tax=Kribbella TaxID=182639 RepID=UPI001053828B|nr:MULTISPECIES: SDR family oxidoreductase [Kribbella]